MALLSLKGQAFLQNTHPPPRPLAARGLEMEPGLGVSEDTHVPSREQTRWATGKSMNMSAVYFFGGGEEYSTVTIKY